jgi:hypothetical protein
VIGAVIGFFRLSTQPITKTSFEDVLIQNDGNWTWQYANRNWRTLGTFARNADGTYNFIAHTFYRRDVPPEHSKIPIFTWRSTKPFSIKAGATEITFECEQTVLESVNKVYPQDAPTPGTYKKIAVLRLTHDLSGTWRDADGSTPPAGWYFTRDFGE